MLSEKIQKAFNEQINAETYSAYLYWSMAAWFEKMNLKGFATWMTVQAQEEMTHAMKFYHFILERGGEVELAAIEAPKTAWESPLAAFEDAYKHECYISSRINDLVDVAVSEKDRPAESFLKWFVDEQVEEEANADEVVGNLKLIGDGPGGGLFMLNREMGQRTFTPPPAQGEEA